MFLRYIKCQYYSHCISDVQWLTVPVPICGPSLRAATMQQREQETRTTTTGLQPGSNKMNLGGWLLYMIAENRLAHEEADVLLQLYHFPATIQKRKQKKAGLQPAFDEGLTLKQKKASRPHNAGKCVARQEGECPACSP